VFVEGDVSRALRDVCELEASEFDPEKNGVTFLWKRVKFMEGNPRRVLVFWAGVEGLELERIMTPSGHGRRGRRRASGGQRSILIYHNRNQSMMARKNGYETTDAFHHPVIPTPSKSAKKTLKPPNIKLKLKPKHYNK
jgi:hypothetical protein